MTPVAWETETFFFDMSTKDYGAWLFNMYDMNVISMYRKAYRFSYRCSVPYFGDIRNSWSRVCCIETPGLSSNKPVEST